MKWKEIKTCALETCEDEKGNKIYYTGTGDDWVTVYIPQHGLRKVLYSGKSQKMARRAMRKFIKEDV